MIGFAKEEIMLGLCSFRGVNVNSYHMYYTVLLKRVILLHLNLIRITPNSPRDRNCWRNDL